MYVLYAMGYVFMSDGHITKLSVHLRIQSTVCVWLSGKSVLCNGKVTKLACPACYVARLSIQLCIQPTVCARLSGTSVLCNGDVFMSVSMEYYVARLDCQFSYV